MTDNQMFFLALMGLFCFLSLIIHRPKVDYSAPDYRLCVDINMGNGPHWYRVQRRVGKRWKNVAKVDDFDEGYWLVNRLQWPRKF